MERLLTALALAALVSTPGRVIAQADEPAPPPAPSTPGEAPPQAVDRPGATPAPEAPAAGASQAADRPGATAGEAAPLPGSQAAERPGSTGGVALPESGFPGWIDESHAAIERRIGELAERLDGFFGEERADDLADRAGSSVRWRNEVRTAQDKPFAFRTSLAASLRLPATQRWLRGMRLVISGESQRDPNRALSDDPANPGFSPVLAAEQASLELRLPIFTSPLTALDAGAGVRLRIPPEPYVRTRLRQKVPLGLGFTLRLSPQAFWESSDGFGVASGIDFDRPLGAHTVARFKNHAQLTEVSKGVEWGSELGVGHEIVPWRTALYLGAAASGDTRPREEVLLYRLFTRVRRDVWRRWLFLELEPEVGWPLRPDGTRPRVLAATLRAEIHFDGEAPPPGVEARRLH